MKCNSDFTEDFTEGYDPSVTMQLSSINRSNIHIRHYRRKYPSVNQSMIFVGTFVDK